MRDCPSGALSLALGQEEARLFVDWDSGREASIEVSRDGPYRVLPALTRMTRLLYEKHVPADDLLAPVFADMPPGHPQREAMWLAEVFGGPEFRAALAGYLEWGSRTARAESTAGAAGAGAPTGAAGRVPAGEPVPRFRARDRQSMLFAFDLWSPVDVQAHAVEILNRLRNGTMPCDGAWPQENTDLFQHWIESGFDP